jgi:hypothetical protein
MIVTEDISKENLYNLKVGQQFLVMEQKDFDYKDGSYYNIQTAFLIQVLLDSIYVIEGLNNNIEPYQYEEDDDYNMGVESNSTGIEMNFLVLNNNVKIELKSVGYLENIKNDTTENGSKIFSKFKSMINTSNIIKCTRTIDYEDNKIEFFMLYPINDKYICYHMYNQIKCKEYYWSHGESIYLVDKDFTNFVSLKFNDNKKFVDLLKDLEPAKYSLDFKDFYDIYYPGNNFDIKDYINNPAGIEAVIKSFENSFVDIPHLYEIFKPIFKDDEIEFKEYFDSRFYNYSDGVRHIYSREKGGSTYDPTSLASIAIRKTKNIKEYLRKQIPINVFNGECIEDREYKEIYKDAGGLIFNIAPKNPDYSGYNHYSFTIIDGIYCQARKDEIEEIEERKKLVEQLTK